MELRGDPRIKIVPQGHSSYAEPPKPVTVPTPSRMPVWPERGHGGLRPLDAIEHFQDELQHYEITELKSRAATDLVYYLGHRAGRSQKRAQWKDYYVDDHYQLVPGDHLDFRYVGPYPKLTFGERIRNVRTKRPNLYHKAPVFFTSNHLGLEWASSSPYTVIA